MTEDEMKAIAEGLMLSGVFEAADAEHRRRLEADPEWTTPKWRHVHDLVTAFAVGVLRADPWHHGYKLPPDFENVVNWIAFCVQEKYSDEVVRISLLEYEDFIRKCAHEHPSFLEWNETDELISISHRYSETPDERDFIDLDALIRNAAVYLRNEIRRDEEFDRKFEEKYGHLDSEE